MRNVMMLPQILLDGWQHKVIVLHSWSVYFRKEHTATKKFHITADDSSISGLFITSGASMLFSNVFSKRLAGCSEGEDRICLELYSFSTSSCLLTFALSLFYYVIYGKLHCLKGTELWTPLEFFRKSDQEHPIFCDAWNGFQDIATGLCLETGVCVVTDLALRARHNNSELRLLLAAILLYSAFYSGFSRFLSSMMQISITVRKSN